MPGSFVEWYDDRIGRAHREPDGSSMARRASPLGAVVTSSRAASRVSRMTALVASKAGATESRVGAPTRADS
jgi:hypothetical protein